MRDDAAFLNHGSFGACPIEVQEEQNRIRREMEEAPDFFFRERIVPRGDEDSDVRRVARRLGGLVGAAGERIALLDNVTFGTQSVLESLAFEPGDQILITDHQYNAVRLAVEQRCKDTGAVPCVATLGVPQSAGEVVSRIREAATPKVRLAIVDHITSPTAMLLPVAQIAEVLHERGIPVLIDGAHAIGQIPLDLDAIGADWYEANAHKWLCAPKGSAFVYALPQAAAKTRSAIVSHFTGMGFPRSFDYVGTRDYSSWLATPAAASFFERLGPQQLWDYEAALIAFATRRLAEIGIEPLTPDGMHAAMRTFVLPQRRKPQDGDVLDLLRRLWNEERIQVQIVSWGERLLLRVSAQAYVDEDDITRLAAVLEKGGWPGR